MKWNNGHSGGGHIHTPALGGHFGVTETLGWLNSFILSLSQTKPDFIGIVYGWMCEFNL